MPKKKATNNHPRKLIGGSWHVRFPCWKCRELVWFSESFINWKCQAICDDCFNRTHIPSTGGGIRVIKKGEMFS